MSARNYSAMENEEQTALPESVETLLNWKLANTDVPFSDEEFLNGFEEHAQASNALFDAAFVQGL